IQTDEKAKSTYYSAQADFPETYKRPEGWSSRLKVAIDVARGLACLHEVMDNQVAFGDFKYSNVHVYHRVEGDTVKLSNFGLPHKGLKYLSTQDVGNLQYVAPEYIDGGHLTSKSDVWSYGVFLFELITANMCLSRKPESRPEMRQVLEMVNQLTTEQSETASPAPPLQSLVPTDLQSLVPTDVQGLGSDEKIHELNIKCVIELAVECATTRKSRTGDEVFLDDICRPGNVTKRRKSVRRGTNSDGHFSQSSKKRKKHIEQRPPLSVRSSRSSSPTKPTTPCSSLSALAGESLRMNVGLDRGIKTSSTGKERIGELVTEMKAGVRQSVGELA
nr:hypothetical protein [Tanacetum cinerariifolium]